MKTKMLLLLLLIGFCATSCNNTKNNKKKSESLTDLSSAVYYNGDIITMEGATPTYAEAVVSSEGKIAFIGSLKDAEVRFKNATRHDLNGATMLPAFLDGHGHMYSAAFAPMLANT